MKVKESVEKEALQKFREHISDATICMVTNNILEWSLQPESLNNQWLDDQGSIWFLCFQNRPDNSPLRDGRMEVFYSNRMKSKFLSLVGEIQWASFDEAENVDGFPFHRERIASIKTPLRLARFFPHEAFFWDDSAREMVPILLFNSRRNGTNSMMIA